MFYCNTCFVLLAFLCVAALGCLPDSILINDVDTSIIEPFADGKKWMTIQRRVDDSVDFLRKYAEYENLFGSYIGNFWIGLKTINRLTNTNRTLLIVMEDWEGNFKYAKYTTFKVGDASTKYKLTVGGYSGDAGDSLTYQNGMKFTTIDQDNDLDGINCATQFKGAWWYNKCHASNLNGKYWPEEHTAYADGIHWKAFLGYNKPLKTARMLLSVEYTVKE